MTLLMCLFVADREGLFEGFWLSWDWVMRMATLPQVFRPLWRAPQFGVS